MGDWRLPAGGPLVASAEQPVSRGTVATREWLGTVEPARTRPRRSRGYLAIVPVIAVRKRDLAGAGDGFRAPSRFTGRAVPVQCSQMPIVPG